MSDSKEEEVKDPLSKAISGLKLREIGPAVMGGRIIDIAVHPTKRSTWYVAVGSGGVWKTTNAGTTWTPIFDKQPSYSIGCVTLDPSNPAVVWVGTGENVSGRHVGWGSGVYRSLNGGASWEQMGLTQSEHIGKILVDPRDGNVVYVAAEGALWSSGGERGVFKTTDGGQNWEAVLEIDEHTGVTDIVFDPTNPDLIIAAAYQRRRHIYAFLGGGPGSGIYKTTDGGSSWRKMTEGLPQGDMGKIGLATTPANPNVVYATIEANAEEKGFYRSTNKGESWEKRNSYTSGGTGPHYYQVIAASPTNADLVYQMDVFIHVTRNGGKTMARLEDAKGKHSDNHAIWIDPDDGDHLIVGCDGGLYESFDDGKTYRHVPNLPIAQFYRTAVDNSLPFYHILGGAQDLGTLFGPSRTTHIEGVRSQDWWVPMGADGYHVAFDPEEPEIMYVEWQQGNLLRYDRRDDELVDIKPLPGPNEPPERWNWDAPIIISPHNRKRLYYASYRVWMSPDQGNSWETISPDLTQNLNRYELPFIERVWSVNDLIDNGAMSQYSTITNLSESPLVEGLIYAATDDGLIQVRDPESGGWQKAAVLPELPENSFIQCVEASLHAADTVFAIGDAHKIGDYAPYIYESRDRGQTWTSIRGNLPDGTILWALQQDHEAADLLFIAAEYGLYVSLNRGENWHKLNGNVPTIAFRDLKIQRRESDLVGASFGRGFFVLDDYSALRGIASGAVEEKGALFPVRDAWWYIPQVPMQSRGQPTLGNTAFKGPNPDFGALITYHIKDEPKSSKKVRRDAEKELRKESQDTPFPGVDRLRQEALEADPQVLFIIRSADGQAVRQLTGTTSAGLHRISWDLRSSPTDPIQLKKPDFQFPWESDPQGPLVPPGRYTVEMVWLGVDGHEQIGEPQGFEVKALPTTGDQAVYLDATQFQSETAGLIRELRGVAREVDRAENRLKHLRAALTETPAAPLTYYEEIDQLTASLASLKLALLRDEVLNKLNEASRMSVLARVGRIAWMHWGTRQRPTETQRQSFETAKGAYTALKGELTQLLDVDLPTLEAALSDLGAPWTPDRKL
ncbi:MAG: glycosyl hydrolase [Chloroflexota bacterium]